MQGIYIAGIAFITIVVGILIYLFLTPTAPTSALVNGPFDLSSTQTILSTASFPTQSGSVSFLNSGTGSFQVFVYLDGIAKTGVSAPCSDTGSGKPSCITGLYDPCKCTAVADCTNCQHVGYRSLFSLYGVYNFEILNVPDASRQNSVSAQMAINTISSPDAFVETIPLPAIPIQKWILISVVKDGRQINVYYNNSLVSSSKMLNMISNVNMSGTVAVAGNGGLTGMIGLVRMLSNKMLLNDVNTYYSESTDTRGAPNGLSTTIASSGAQIGPAKNTLAESLCLDLSCIKLPSVNLAPVNEFLQSPQQLSPISNLYTFNTQYD